QTVTLPPGPLELLDGRVRLGRHDEMDRSSEALQHARAHFPGAEVRGDHDEPAPVGKDLLDVELGRRDDLDVAFDVARLLRGLVLPDVGRAVGEFGKQPESAQVIPEPTARAEHPAQGREGTAPVLAGEREYDRGAQCGHDALEPDRPARRAEIAEPTPEE